MRRRSWEAGMLVVALSAWIAGCGGHARNDAPASSGSASGGTDVASTFGGSASITGIGGSLAPPLPNGSGDDVSAGAAGGASSDLRQCQPVPEGSCPEVKLDLLALAQSNVWSEPLQLPDYGTRPEGYYPPAENTDPASWDRSPLPAGACVFRIHGLPAACLRPGTLWEDSCNPGPLGDGKIHAPSFYDSSVCMRGAAPGCPTADPWNAAGYWWYLIPDAENVDIVVCAPECASSIVRKAPCLELSGPMP